MQRWLERECRGGTRDEINERGREGYFDFFFFFLNCQKIAETFQFLLEKT